METNSILLPEIWLLILLYLKPNDLRSLALVDKRFLRLAQPSLFSVLDVSPFLRTYNEHPIRRPQEYLTRFIQRLEYYKKPHIVHAVQHCWISPYTRAGFPQRDEQDDLDPGLVIDAVLDALTVFPNLKALSWHCIDLTPRWWSVIARLRVKRLWINSSSFVGFEEEEGEPERLRYVERVDLDQWPWEGNITNQVSIHESNSAGVDFEVLSRIIRPDVVQTITVPRMNTAARLFELLASHASVQPDAFRYTPAALEQSGTQLRTLKIPYSVIRDDNLVSALTACAGLQTLCIFPPTSDERFKVRKVDSDIARLLPNLRTYEGPYHLLPFFAKRRAGVVETLSLWGLDDRPAFADPDAVADALTSLSPSAYGRRGLKELRLLVTRISQELLDMLSQFQELEKLEIHSQDSPTTNREFKLFLSHPIRNKAPILNLYALLLRTEFPKTLKYITLHTRLSSTPSSSRHTPPPQPPVKDGEGSSSQTKDSITIPSSQERAAAEFTEGLAKLCPNLHRVEVNYGIYWTGMCTAVWGRIRENDNYQTQRGWKMLKKKRCGHDLKEKRRDNSSQDAWDPANGNRDAQQESQRPESARTPSSASFADSDTVATSDESDNDLDINRPVAPRKIKEGYSSKSSSKEYILSTVVSSVHPLPLGKLTFTEHRRTILLQDEAPGVALGGLGGGWTPFVPSNGGNGSGQGRDQEGSGFLGLDWTSGIWTRVRRFIGLN
ncbi:hypothetical protein CVT24_012949 [Panaeolus cyanescens]|uniref:F-box domain-containing protein n=1 Tax=Panaeolus cyanescens TaxID=181874 RepID=A0A409W6C4_9AGAR|nr:hypothetical protein CVT24_012949 [Panaeolus cyanescens]